MAVTMTMMMIMVIKINIFEEDTGPSALCPSFLKITLRGRYDYYPHFTDEKFEASITT